jgi:hypothetical protein
MANIATSLLALLRLSNMLICTLILFVRRISVSKRDSAGGSVTDNAARRGVWTH